MALVLALLNCSRDPGTLSFSDWGKGRTVRELESQIAALTLGTHTGSLDVQRDPAVACGALQVASGSGAVGGTVGGKLVTAAWATSDAVACDAIVGAILTDSTANQFVGAVSRAATQTVTIASGAGAISVAVNAPSAAVANVTQADVKTYSVTWAASDTATAAALVALINADGTSPVFASSSAGVITLFARPAANSGAGNTPGNLILLAVTGTGVSKGGSALAGGGTNANVVVYALVPGAIGKGVTLVASGTGVTAPSGANLVAGVGALGNSFTC